VVEIQAGEGGDDSKLFVEDLFEAYLKYASNNGLEIEILYNEYGKASFKALGNKAANLFSREPGKHVVQRCPPTENKGRRHTSTITVAVLPIVAERDFKIRDCDLETTTQRGHGKGGQHQNTTDSAVRMKHRPTGITVFINGRDQHANKREARQIIESRVAVLEQEKLHSRFSSEKRKQVDGGNRSNKVRTYNFIDNRVTDHNLGLKTTQIDKVMKGKFELIWKQ
jgi:peptide chain release factor 1